MLVKEYYRISELKERFNVSVEDIKYLVENSQIELVFYLENHKYIFGGWLKDKGFVGFGTLNYRGLVKVTEQEQQELALKGNKTIKSLKLINKNDIANVTHDYPYESPTPNSFLHDWQPKAIDAISWDYIPVKLFHNEKEHHLRSVGKMFTDAIAMIDPKPLPKNDVMDKVPQKGFYHAGIKLLFSDSCVLHKDLIALNIIKSELTINTNQATSNNERPIDTLLTRLLEQFPENKPAKVWEILKADLNNEPRLLDTDEIIDEIDLETLYWFDDKAENK